MGVGHKKWEEYQGVRDEWQDHLQGKCDKSNCPFCLDPELELVGILYNNGGL